MSTLFMVHVLLVLDYDLKAAKAGSCLSMNCECIVFLSISRFGNLSQVDFLIFFLHVRLRLFCDVAFHLLIKD
jgi:hypothetical protein